MGWEAADVVRFDLGPLLESPTRKAKFKSAHNSLSISRGGLQYETKL